MTVRELRKDLHFTSGRVSSSEDRRVGEANSISKEAQESSCNKKKRQGWKSLQCWTKIAVATGLRGNSFRGINEHVSGQ